MRSHVQSCKLAPFEEALLSFGGTGPEHRLVHEPGVSAIAAHPPSPTADDPLSTSHTLSLFQSVTLLPCSLNASP